MKNSIKRILVTICLVFMISGVGTILYPIVQKQITNVSAADKKDSEEEFNIKDIPQYADEPYIEVNDNEPFFNEEDYSTKSFEKYSKLDKLGRCGVALANVGKDIMPTEERGKIGSVKPTGWHTKKYDCVDGKYLYNRCHLLGYQLTAENANKKNLITGTRYLNVEGMLPFENMVADYVKETENHVLYRVTPIFEEDNLLASGVLIEAYSIEDEGEGICYCVYCYNVQPKIEIDYLSGNSKLKSEDEEKKETKGEEKGYTYVLNTNTKKFHKPSCKSVKTISQKNYKEYSGSAGELINKGYSACKNCKP